MSYVLLKAWFVVVTRPGGFERRIEYYIGRILPKSTLTVTSTTSAFCSLPIAKPAHRTPHTAHRTPHTAHCTPHAARHIVFEHSDTSNYKYVCSPNPPLLSPGRSKAQRTAVPCGEHAKAFGKAYSARSRIFIALPDGCTHSCSTVDLLAKKQNFPIGRKGSTLATFLLGRLAAYIHARTHIHTRSHP